ncbi:hypothetical protein HDU85_006876 [Gaertneriomyces sp. JEL0708]|nr:hypothetical protein HDU85_006876 [Gaertneriomyces sp. JEL0708]
MLLRSELERKNFTPMPMSELLHSIIRTIIFNNIHDSFARLKDLANALVTQHRSGQLEKPPRLMILVDEYDRYANRVMLENTQQYLASLEDKDKAASLVLPLRSFLEALKSLSSTRGLEYRTLIVGLTPLAFADASGANIWSNISHEPIFSNVCGFTEKDLKRGLSDLGFEGDKQTLPLMIMKRCFNGYTFPESMEPLYHPQMCLFVFKRLRSGRLTSERLVEISEALAKNENTNLMDLDDTNSRFSRKVLELLAHLPALSILSSLSKRTPYILCPSLSSTIFMKQESMDLSLPDPARVQPTQIDYLVSFLYYHGGLTIKEKVGPTRYVFDIPNLMIKPVFLGLLQRHGSST